MNFEFISEQGHFTMIIRNNIITLASLTNEILIVINLVLYLKYFYGRDTICIKNYRYPAIFVEWKCPTTEYHSALSTLSFPQNKNTCYLT